MGGRGAPRGRARAWGASIRRGRRAEGEADCCEYFVLDEVVLSRCLPRTRTLQTTKDAYYSAVATAKGLLAQDPVVNASAQMPRTWNEYQISMLVLGENTLENAKRLGYLDAQELYPDIAPLSLEEFAKRFYAMEDPGVVFSQGD